MKFTPNEKISRILSCPGRTAMASVASFSRDWRVSRSSEITSLVDRPSKITTSNRSCAIRIPARTKSGQDSERMLSSFSTPASSWADASSTQTNRADRVISIPHRRFLPFHPTSYLGHVTAEQHASFRLKPMGFATQSVGARTRSPQNSLSYRSDRESPVPRLKLISLQSTPCHPLPARSRGSCSRSRPSWVWDCFSSQLSSSGHSIIRLHRRWLWRWHSSSAHPGERSAPPCSVSYLRSFSGAAPTDGAKSFLPPPWFWLCSQQSWPA